MISIISTPRVLSKNHLKMISIFSCRMQNFRRSFDGRNLFDSGSTAQKPSLPSDESDKLIGQGLNATDRTVRLPGSSNAESAFASRFDVGIFFDGRVI